MEANAELLACYIDRNRIYPMPVFRLITGWDDRAVRNAKRKGLKVCRPGKRAFVRGEDFDDYLKGQQAE